MEFYLANFANYEITYGSFGAIIAFLLWLYIVSVVVLLGAEINAGARKASPFLRTA